MTNSSTVANRCNQSSCANDTNDTGVEILAVRTQFLSTASSVLGGVCSDLKACAFTLFLFFLLGTKERLIYSFILVLL